ncbi:hypothetical protein HY572_02850 [Candidatus Micrarchaeota archaeon]|nr:hypothetical protein [Candidatus Micrarchaeota archaeon]
MEALLRDLKPLFEETIAPERLSKGTRIAINSDHNRFFRTSELDGFATSTPETKSGVTLCGKLRRGFSADDVKVVFQRHQAALVSGPHETSAYHHDGYVGIQVTGPRRHDRLYQRLHESWYSR